MSYDDSAWSPTARDEYCMDFNGTSKSFAENIPYDAYTMQLLLIAYASTLCNVFVLLVHWTTPPHPKFLLLLNRKISIRIHVISGTIEIIMFLAVWFIPLIEDSHQTLVYISAAASVMHCLTALYQMPIVFGTQAIMLPAYAYAIAVKIACVIDVVVYPSCALKFLRLYNIHSIYTWCRAFMFIFSKLHIMRQNMYSISIIMAGFVCAPAYGPGVPVVMVLFVGAYCFILKAVGSPATIARQLSENSRDMFDNPRIQSTLDTLKRQNKRSASSCPFAQMGGDEHDELFRAVFNSMDKSGDGRIQLDEIEAFAELHQSQMWTDLITIYKQTKDLDEQERGMDFEDFKRVVGSKARVSRSVESSDPAVRKQLMHVVSDHAAYDEQARFIFDAIDSNEDGFISHAELAYLLIQYSLPLSDVQKIIRKHDDDGDGQLSFDEFKRGMTPLIKFQIKELRQTIRKDEVAVARTQTLKDLTTDLATRRTARPHAAAARSDGRGIEVVVGEVPATSEHVDEL